jgi:hypothetical protein
MIAAMKMTRIAVYTPSGVNVSAADGQVSLSWTVSGGALTYTVKRSMKSVEPPERIASGLTSPTFTDNTAGNGKTYEYVVTASNANGESAPFAVSTILMPKPQPRTGLLPPGPGRELTASVCSGCHSLELTANERLTAQGWHDLVGLMGARGAVATDDEFNDITAYLARSFPVVTKKENQ